jgi:NADPH2:quinone reductase
MRAVLLNPPGGAEENMIVTEVPDPDPGEHDAIVAVEYAGCNFADTMMRRGIYPHPKGYPLVAGLELAGKVVATGRSVTNVKAGDRVAGFSEDAGAFAQYCAIPADRLTKLPDAISFDTAAAFFVQALTAWHLLHTVSKTNKGDVVLVHAIGGGVGLYLTQLCVVAGATVIGTIGTAGKEKRPLAYGAAMVVNREQADFVAEVNAFTKGRGVDKIVDSTGGSILDRSFEIIRLLGHVVSYGEAEAKPYANLWERLVRKSLTFTRLHLGHIDCASQAWKDGEAAILKAVSEGTLKVPIEAVFPMDEVHAMYRKLDSRQVSGKLLLKIGA